MAEPDRGTAEVYWAADAQDAHAARGVLEDAGIPARVVGEMLHAAAGDLPWGPTISPRVWVAKRDEERAREVIAAWEARRKAERAAPAAAWTCPRCGAEVEGGFDLCWRCERPRDPPDAE